MHDRSNLHEFMGVTFLLHESGVRFEVWDILRDIHPPMSLFLTCSADLAIYRTSGSKTQGEYGGSHSIAWQTLHITKTGTNSEREGGAQPLAMGDNHQI